MLDDAWEVRCDVNGEKDDCQAWQSQATLSCPAKKDGGWGGFSFTLNNMTRIGPESQVNTNPEPSDWARGISKMEQYEWLSQTAIKCVVMMIIRGKVAICTDQTIQIATPQSIAKDLTIFCESLGQTSHQCS
jgi:hypothetical protein